MGHDERFEHDELMADREHDEIDPFERIDLPEERMAQIEILLM